MQSDLFANPRMPRTRFQGSKRKLAGWIADQIDHLEFQTVLDAFGGTGSVAYELKRRGKSVTYNDLLRFNHIIGTALIENQSTRLKADTIQAIAHPDPTANHDNLIESTFAGIYFTDDENRWLDAAIHQIRRLTHPHESALAHHALFQAAMVKRPYNLFHRKNLYMRSANVERSFGNKVTWDTPFDVHFAKLATEANRAVFDNGQSCVALCQDAVTVTPEFDLVYIDPPYINANGQGVDYRDFYHFLEGVADYPDWRDRVEMGSRHRRLFRRPNPWIDPASICDAFDALFRHFADCTIVVSYRSDGVPTIDDLRQMLACVKSNVEAVEYDAYQYALSTNKRSREILLIAQ